MAAGKVLLQKIFWKLGGESIDRRKARLQRIDEFFGFVLRQWGGAILWLRRLGWRTWGLGAGQLRGFQLDSMY